MVDDRALRFRQQVMPPVPTPPSKRESRTIFGQPVDYDRNVRQGRGFLDFLNPVPSLTSAVAERRAPKASDVALDAGLFAAGFIPFAGPGIRGAGQAARPALETGEAIAARRNAIMKLLNEEGPNALSWYLGYPMLGYRGEGAEILSKFFRETPERIPAGTQMYRAPSAGQVQPRYGSQSVPLPREVGAEWRPGRVQSTAGSEDLQQLGELLTGIGNTGGGQRYAPGMMQIEAMEDLPGIYNLNDYFESNNAFRGKIPEISSFNRESVLAPQLRYVVRDYVPNSGEGFPTWYLNAYSR